MNWRPVLFGVSLAVSTMVGRAADDSAPVVQRTMSVDTLDVAPVASDYPVGFSLLTHPPDQFVAYYDKDHRLTVAQRKLDARKWVFTKLPDTTGWDSHNYIALTADDDGYLHLCADMHASPLIYFRTTKPWDASTFKRIAQMTGVNEEHCTYPDFMRGVSNVLLFTYRDGGSGNGNQLYNQYELKTQTWHPFLDAPLTDGQGTNNAYFNGPVRGPDGWFHLAWVWRAKSDAATCHDLSYARSRDLQHWETSAGKPLTLPIRLATCEIIDPVPEHGGMINGNTKIGFDATNRVTISYHKNDTNGNTQPYVIRLEDGHWVEHQVTDWPAPAIFSGTGTLPKEIHLGGVHANADGRLTMSFDHFIFGHGNWVLDPQSLHAIDTIVPETNQLDEVAGSFPGLTVHWAGDEGKSGVEGLHYRLRWETLGANRDRRPSGVLPKPSMLQLIATQWTPAQKNPAANATNDVVAPK